MRPRPKLRTFCRWMLTILVVVLVVVWIGSGWYYVSCAPDWPSGSRQTQMSIALHEGVCEIVVDKRSETWPGVFTFGWNIQGDSSSNFFRFWSWFHQHTNRSFVVVFPAWILLSLLTIPTARMWRTHIIARRRKPGMCKKCGYDISGLVGKEACPECGTLFKIEEAQASAS